MSKFFKRVFSVAALGLLVLSLISALSNLGLPHGSSITERLDAREKARLAEFFHLRQTLGESVWPGWGQANIPVILYNEAYIFLLGYPLPPDGWLTVPGREQQGGSWDRVPGDTFEGRVYYRQPLSPADEVPQAFTVRVGDYWAASLPTKEWMTVLLIEQLQRDLPALLRPVFPYRLATSLLLGGSDSYIAMLAHESFHAHQGWVAEERLVAAESATQWEARYPWDNPDLQDAWREELALLRAALDAETNAESRALVRQFLEHRQQRRQMFSLEGPLTEYEQQREWLEGTAKYVELEIWRQAFLTPGYKPVDLLAGDSQFENYAAFEKRWSQEMAQMARMADDEGDGRFYYSGMAQSVLLDRLLPAWKISFLDGGEFLETLLEEALDTQR